MAGKCQESHEHPVKAFGWAARDSSGLLSPFHFSRRATLEDDVRFKVLYCGICHTDLHLLKNDWGVSSYPLVPGHEIVGEVTEVGMKVRKVKVGDKVGVGYMVGSCRSCGNCCQDLENYCPEMVLTAAGQSPDGSVTYGGYSNEMVCNEHFVIRFPETMVLDACAPLLCAGVTVFSPMKYYGLAEAGKHIGVNGLGGVGHLAVKFAKAFGAKVTVISTSPDKKDEAINHLGADAFLVGRNEAEMQAAKGTMDGIIDCVSAKHPLVPLLSLLNYNGKLVLLGVPPEPLELPAAALVMAKHNITADVEVVPMDYVNTAMERLAKGDVRYRFVLDVANTLTKAA